MPLKRQSFLDRLTSVVNPQGTEEELDDVSTKSDTHDDDDMEMEHTEHMRLEVPVKASREPEIAHKEDVGKLLVDMYESDGSLVVQSMIAGVTPENLQIAITRDRLTIKGKREMTKGIPHDQYHVGELYWGTFERVIDLPFEVDAENAEAVEKYGLLIIRLPRLDTEKIQELRVKSV